MGSGPALGNWKPAESRGALEWSEGDIWTGELPTSEGGEEFKFVVARGGEVVEWEEGGNRVLRCALVVLLLLLAGARPGSEERVLLCVVVVVVQVGVKVKARSGEAREAAASAPSPLGMRGGRRRTGRRRNAARRLALAYLLGGGGGGGGGALAPGGAEWVGAAPRFMRSNEHSSGRGDGIRWDSDAIDDDAAGGSCSRALRRGRRARRQLPRQARADEGGAEPGLAAERGRAPGSTPSPPRRCISPW